MLRDVAKKAGIEHVSSQCFRRSYRSWLDAGGNARRGAADADAAFGHPHHDERLRRCGYRRYAESEREDGPDS